MKKDSRSCLLLFNLLEWVELAGDKLIECGGAALIWFIILAVGDVEVVIAQRVYARCGVVKYPTVD